jgi:hypothetical protein
MTVTATLNKLLKDSVQQGMSDLESHLYFELLVSIL